MQLHYSYLFQSPSLSPNGSLLSAKLGWYLLSASSLPFGKKLCRTTEAFITFIFLSTVVRQKGRSAKYAKSLCHDTKNILNHHPSFWITIHAFDTKHKLAICIHRVLTFPTQSPISASLKWYFALQIPSQATLWIVLLLKCAVLELWGACQWVFLQCTNCMRKISYGIHWHSVLGTYRKPPFIRTDQITLLVFVINVETVSRLSLLLEAFADWLSPVT